MVSLPQKQRTVHYNAKGGTAFEMRTHSLKPDRHGRIVLHHDDRIVFQGASVAVSGKVSVLTSQSFQRLLQDPPTWLRTS